ncbi:MAG: HD domain-containing protein [Clostridiales bacterium]|nr:HD domain-containing protein [Clostridiales bacterium]
MSKLSNKLISAISILSIVSFIILGYCIHQLDTKDIPLLLFWVFLGALFESLPIYYAKGRAVSVTFAIFVASQLSHGTYFTTIVAAISTVLVYIKNDDGTVTHPFNLPIRFTLINFSNFAISMFISGSVVQIFKNAWTPIFNTTAMSAWLTVILVAIFIFLVFLLNSTIMSLYASLISNSSFRKIWVTNTLWALPNFIAIAPLGFFLHRIYEFPNGFIYILMILGPILLSRYSFKLYLDVKEQHYNTIKTLTAAIEAKDEYTEGHSRRVEHYVEQVSEKMKLPPNRIESIKVAALLHDIGKIGVRDSILGKPGRLTDKEYEIVQQHPSIGVRILEEANLSQEIVDAILHHHEHYNGNGYPDKLKGDEVSLHAYIIGVVDAYDAMTSDRPYRKALSKERAISILIEERGKQFHPEVVDTLVFILNSEKEEITREAIVESQSEVAATAEIGEVNDIVETISLKSASLAEDQHEYEIKNK